MKTAIVFVAVIAFAVAQDQLTTSASMTQAPGQAGSACTSTKGCGEGFCCVTRFLGKKKRLFLDNLFGGGSSRGGHCQPERKENESCHVFMDHDLFNPDLFDDYCPCMTGLECRGETVDETGGSIVHHNPKCQPKQSSATNP